MVASVGRLTVEEIAEIYFQSWKLGLKAVALYRDGCKLSQPLQTRVKDDSAKPAADAPAAAPAAAAVPAPLRRKRLPRRRYGFTQEARIAGHKVFIRTGEYDDGQLGEIFIDMHKEGAAFRSMMNCFAIAVSMGLQYGVPLEDLVDQFVFTRFEPQGRVEGHDNVKSSTSVIDYIFRVLGIEYLNRMDLAHIVDEVPTGQLVHRPSRTHWKEHHGGNGNGNGNGSSAIGDEGSRNDDDAASAMLASDAEPAALRSEGNAVLPRATHSKFHGEAPMCDICGNHTIRNGTCFKCLNCGNSLGCS